MEVTFLAMAAVVVCSVAAGIAMVDVIAEMFL